MEEELFQTYPYLREVAAQVEAGIAKDNYDPNDWRDFTWLYYRLETWHPSRFLQLLAAVATYAAARRVVSIIRARYTVPQLIALFVSTEVFIVPILAFAIPFLLMAYVMYRHHGQPHSDGLTRNLVMYNLSALMLMPVAAMAATGNPVLSMTLGIWVRMGMQLPALWFWYDLYHEVRVSDRPFAYVFRAWRWLVTYLVLLPGILLRTLALSNRVPLTGMLVERATVLRLRIAKMFPVALSLFADPRGLFLAACLIASAVFVYMLHLVVYATPLFRIRNHRECNTWLTYALVQCKVILPNVHPEEARMKSTAPPNVKSYTPAAAMMLRYNDSVFELDSSFLTSEAIMPIFSYLEKEKEILKTEGATHWIKPRDEPAPDAGLVDELQLAKFALENWSRPLDSVEAEMNFTEYFQTINDDEYQYDPDSGNWVFDDEALANQMTDQPVNPVDNNAIDFNTLERIGPEGDDSIAISVPPELQPWLEKFAEQEKQRTGMDPWLEKFVDGDETHNEDDTDDPPVTVFV